MSGILGPVAIIPAVTNNMTGVIVVTSAVVDLRTNTCASLQAVWTGTAAGSFSIQGSLTYKPNAVGGQAIAGTWDDIGASFADPAGSAGHSLVDLALTGIPFIRVVYTNASGTGTLLVMACSK